MENRFVEDYDPTIEGTLGTLFRTQSQREIRTDAGWEGDAGTDPPPHTNVVADARR